MKPLSRGVKPFRVDVVSPSKSRLVLTQKPCTFCVNKSMPNQSESADSKILDRLQAKRRGWVFTPNHLSDLGTRNAVASALKRLKATGTIRQLARGLYDNPVEDPVLGKVAPSADAIARALVVRDAIRLQPSGDYAANLLGLSEQVPSRVVFLTDGPPRKVKIGKREILLKRTTPRNMATAGRKSGLMIQALRHLGRLRINDQVVATIARQIPVEDRAAILKDLRHAPAWIGDILRPLVAPPP